MYVSVKCVHECEVLVRTYVCMWKSRGPIAAAVGCDQRVLVSHAPAPQLRPRLRRSVEIQLMQADINKKIPYLKCFDRCSPDCDTSVSIRP